MLIFYFRQKEQNLRFMNFLVDFMTGRLSSFSLFDLDFRASKIEIERTV